MTTLLDHRITLAYLAYLGYPQQPQTSALLITRPRKHDRKRGKVTRNVFLCYICGAAGSGKTTLLRSFAGKPYREAYESTSKPISVVNSVDINGSEKYLVVSKFSHMYFLLLMSSFCSMALMPSYKNSGPSTRPRRYETRRRRISQT